MKVLVIPDIHLKPWMFNRAAELLKDGIAGGAVCLMDIPDDWRQEFNLDLYVQAFDAASQFAKDFPETLWCWIQITGIIKAFDKDREMEKSEDD